MKTLTKVLLCLALLTAMKTGVPASDMFAPLISENCIAFVHADFSKIEIDNVKTALQKTSEHVLKELGFDEKSFTATARELSIELEKLDVLVRPAWETLTKEIGITEVAVFIDWELHVQSGVPIIAIPWKNKTDAHLETLRTLLQLPENSGRILKIDGFLLLIESWFTENVSNWAKAIKPAPATSLIHEALHSVADADIKVAVALPQQLRTMVQSGAGLPPEMPNEVRGLLLFAAQRIQWASASLSLQDIQRVLTHLYVFIIFPQFFLCFFQCRRHYVGM